MTGFVKYFFRFWLNQKNIEFYWISGQIKTNTHLRKITHVNQKYGFLLYPIGIRSMLPRTAE